MFVVAQEQRKHCIFPIDHSSVQRLVYELIPALRETTSQSWHTLTLSWLQLPSQSQSLFNATRTYYLVPSLLWLVQAEVHLSKIAYEIIV